MCRVALGMLGAMCGANKECAAELWKVCEQEPQCIHDIWHLRREQGEISELQVPITHGTRHLSCMPEWEGHV